MLDINLNNGKNTRQMEKVSYYLSKLCVVIGLKVQNKASLRLKVITYEKYNQIRGSNNIENTIYTICTIL